MKKDTHSSTSYTLLDRVTDPNNNNAWHEFTKYYEPFIYNVLRKFQISDSDAVELRHEIILKLWKKIPELKYDRNGGKFRNWLATVTINHTKSFLRTKNKQDARNVNTDDHEFDQFMSSTDDNEIEAMINDEWKLYISNLAWDVIKKRFDENIQEIFMLHIKGKSGKEIGEELDIPQNTVNVYIHRVRNHLKDEIKKLDQELF